MFPITLCILTKQISLQWRELLMISYRPIVAAVIMGAVVYQVTVIIGEQQSNIIGIASLLGSIALGTLIYTTVLIMLWWLAGKPLSAEMHAIDLIKRNIKYGNGS